MDYYTSGRTNINAYIVSSDAVAASRSARDIVAGKGGSDVSCRFKKRSVAFNATKFWSVPWLPTHGRYLGLVG